MVENEIIIKNQKLKLRIYTKKRNKNVIFSIKNGYIYISKPKNVSDREIERLILENKEKIFETYSKINSNSYNLIKLDKIMYNGKCMNLKIEKSFIEKLEISKENIYIFINNLCNVKNLLIKFYKYNLENIIKDRLKYYLNIFNSNGHNISFNRVKISLLKSRWGSCSYKNKNLSFNIKLMMLPNNVIDYIIIHELAHLIYPNHSKEFWKIVEMYCKEYKQYNKYLKDNYYLFLYLD